MKIAVLSGKGGAGKTFVAVNLAAAAEQACYIDCDVEEPNGRLFFKPRQVRSQRVSTLLPSFDAERCVGCKQCVTFCRFHALVYIQKMPMVFSEVCHSCGGCAMVCPQQAIREVERPVGVVELGSSQNVRVVTGILNPGEASGVPVIKAALREASDGLTVIDCPPGSACSVMESILDADYCLLVAEPTAFGFHNFQMVKQLTTLLGKPCGVVINKLDSPYAPLEDFCREASIPVLARIPYDSRIAGAIASGEIPSREDPAFSQLFRDVLSQIGGISK